MILSLNDVVSKLAAECDETAVSLCNSARKLRNGKQKDMRNLCSLWGVSLREKKGSGNYGNRSDTDIKTDLTTVVIEKATERLRATTSQTQQPAFCLLYTSPSPRD